MGFDGSIVEFLGCANTMVTVEYVILILNLIELHRWKDFSRGHGFLDAL